MRRRTFLKAVAGTPFAGPLAARAQEAGRVYRLAMLGGGRSSATDAVLETLRRHGFVDGENLKVEHRGFAQHVDLIPQYAAELVKLDPDVLFATGDAAIRAMQKLTSTIPLLGVTEDMVGSGFVVSLAHPDGNTTGVSLLSAELDIKRQQILIDAIPAMRVMAALVDADSTQASHLEAMQAEARARNVELVLLRVSKSEEIGPAIEAAKTARAAALNVLASPMLFGNGYHAARGVGLHAVHLPVCGHGGGGRLCRLWSDLGVGVRRYARAASDGQASAWREAFRSAGRAAGAI
jgi:putative tryptophan/tyrosine transport system substrate-binding protein